MVKYKYKVQVYDEDLDEWLNQGRYSTKVMANFRKEELEKVYKNHKFRIIDK